MDSLSNGRIKYRFKRILLEENFNEKFLYSHDEILSMLMRWNGSVNQNKKHLLLKSNYPWVFSSRNEIKTRDNLESHKILPIIALSEIGRKSLTALKNVIIHDKYAHLIELLTRIGVFKKWSKGLSKVPTTAKCKQCLVHGVNIMMKKKIMYYAPATSPPLSNSSKDFVLDCENILKALYSNDENYLLTCYNQTMDFYRVEPTEINQLLNKRESIQFIRSICEIVLGNNRKIISYLQGKESAVRTAVPKRVLSCRAQISLAPFLQPTQIGVPYWWAKYLNFEHPDEYTNNFRICETLSIYEKLPDEFIYKLHGQRIIAKRDPIIHILAFSVYDQVYFHADSRVKIGPESLKIKAADFDGDTYIFYFSDDFHVMYEIDYNASPRFCMALHGQCRMSLIESIVLSMYKRNVDGGKIPYWQLYDFVRRRQIYRWLVNKRNCATLEAISDMSGGKVTKRQLYQMVEPTELILSEVLVIIYTIYGSRESYRFYCEILRLTMELSIKLKSATLYQDDLPCDYTLTDNLLNFDLLAASLSCAKGTIHTYKSLLDKLYDRDQNTELMPASSPSYSMGACESFDYEKLIGDITNANVFAAKKSKQVPQQGYNLFKDTIEGDLMSFAQNKLNYSNSVLIDDIYLKIPFQYILDPCVAFAVLFEQ